MNWFPLIRHFSRGVTLVLARLPVTPNQITVVSLAAGIACAWFLMQGDRRSSIIGGVLLVVSYVLDNCDGEIARLKNATSELGKHLDNVTDTLVHLCLFLALGYGVSQTTGDQVWMWLGVIATGGGVVNTVVTTFLGAEDVGAATATAPVETAGPPDDPGVPVGWKSKVAFFLRELARADFCFVVLVLAIFDQLWVLLPAGAVGAQVYWILRFVPGAGRFRV